MDSQQWIIKSVSILNVNLYIFALYDKLNSLQMESIHLGPKSFHFSPPSDLNLLDWSSRNVLAVALHNSVYLLDATQGDVTFLMSLEREEDYVCSLSWTKEGTYLAIGTSDCKIQVRVNRWTFHLFSVLNDTWQRSALFLFSKWHIFVSLVVGCLQPEASPQHVQSYVEGCKPQLE